MSHELEIFQDGSASFVSQGTRGWHLLGTLKEEGYLDLDEMIVGARLHQPVFKRPLTVSIGMGPDNDVVDGVVIDETTSDDKVGVCRIHPDTGELQLISVVGKDQTIFQPREVFSFTQNLLSSGFAIGVTAGVLHNGKVIFASFKLPGHMMIGGVDRHDLYLGVIDSYDGSRKFTAAATPIRFECANTVALGVASAVRTWELKHTKNAELDEDKALKALELTNKYAEGFVAVAETLLSRKLTKAAFDKIIAKEFGPGEEPSKREAGLWETKRDHLLRLFTVADTQANIRGTAWGAYNAVVEYLDWEMPVRGVGDNPTDQNRARFTRSFEALGRGVDETKLAFQKVLLAATK